MSDTQDVAGMEDAASDTVVPETEEEHRPDQQEDTGEQAEEEAGDEAAEAPPEDADTLKASRNAKRTQKIRELYSEREAFEVRALRAEAELQRINKMAGDEPRPVQDDREDYESYLARLSSWQTRQDIAKSIAAEKRAEADDLRKEAQRAEGQVHSAKTEQWVDHAREAQKRYPDFDRVVYDQSVPMPSRVLDIILDTEAPADVAYHIAKDRALAAEIAEMTPYQAARRIVQVEAAVRGPKPRTETQAPKPMQPVKPGGAVVTDPTKMSHEQFVAWRDAGGTF